MQQRKRIVKTLSYIFLIVASFIMIYPVLFMALGSFTTNDRFLDAVFLPIPNTLNIEMFSRALSSGVGASYLFTLERVAFYVVITLFVGVVGGYIFSKLNFPGKNKIFLLFLSGMVMPGVLMLLPTYLMVAWWPLAGGNNILGHGGHGLIDDWPVLFVFGWVPPFAIFLLKQSFDMLPTEYEDAAKMDGAGIWTIIFQVYGPLLKPPLVALTIIIFLGVWNDWLWPAFTISGRPEYYPIAYRMQTVILADTPALGLGTTNYPAEMVRAFLATWPPAAVYFLLQRYFVQGLVSSGLKG